MGNNNKWVLISLLTIMFGFISQPAFAQTNIVSMFGNAISSFDALIRLVKMVSIIIGIFLVISAIYKLTQIGSDPRLTAKVPIVMFFCGIGIFAMVATSGVLTNTLALGTSGPGELFLPQSTNRASAATRQGLLAILTFIRLLGYIAFVRGWLIINDVAQGKQGASLAKGLTHLVGGVFAINISLTAAILANTFAPGVPVPV